MIDPGSQQLSRRQWFGLTPALAAAIAVPGKTSAATAETATGLVGARTYNVRDFGAKGDGKTLDTAAIQSAIDAAARDQGGIVLVPAGNFLTAPIELKSNVTLRIAAGGRLLGSTDPKVYHPANGIPLDGDHTMGDGNTGLVYAANANNVTIEGDGTIDGQGEQLRGNGLNGNRRCHLALFYRCTNLRIRGVYFFHSEYHTVRICNSSYVFIDGIRIFSRTVGNNDGLHFISAEHVYVSNCDVRCQDDACALFGSCRFISVTNSLFSTRWSCFRFGGGRCENINVSNCLIYQVYGCPIKLRCERGSRFENMSFSDLVLENVTGPISLGAGPMAEGAGADQSPAVIRNITFNNIRGNVITKPMGLDDSTFNAGGNAGEMHSCIILNCVKGNVIENISFNNLKLTFGGGGTKEDAARRELPEIANEYFRLGPLPAYGLYARNVRGLTINGARFETATPDLRPALVLDHVTDATVSDFSLQADAAVESALRFIDSQDVYLRGTRLLSETTVFAQVEGGDTRNIRIEGGDIAKAEKPLAFVRGAKDDAVNLRA